MMVISRRSPGKAIQASTNLCVSRSSRPPMNPDSPPTTVATSTATAVRREADQQRQPRAVDVAAQEVAPRMIGSQQMLGRGALQPPGHVLALLGVRCQHVGEDAHQHEQHDDDGAEQAQRLLPDEPAKEVRKRAASGVALSAPHGFSEVAHW